MKSERVGGRRTEKESIDKQRSIKGLEMTTDKQTEHRQRKATAETWFRDAQYEGLSMRARADAAFDACYAYAMVLLGPDIQGRPHPHPDILLRAADKLGWPQSAMEPAVQQLHDRDEPLRDGSRYEKLLALARRLREVV